LQRGLLRYVDFLMSQITQTAACNRFQWSSRRLAALAADDAATGCARTNSA